MVNFDYHHYEEMRQFIFPKYSKNKFIYNQMAYVLHGDSKCNNISVRAFNTWWKMINNTLWVEDTNIWLDCAWLQFLLWYLFRIHHIRNYDLCGYGWTPYDIIKFIHLCHVRHIRNEYICFIEETLCEFNILALISVSLIDYFNSPF